MTRVRNYFWCFMHMVNSPLQYSEWPPWQWSKQGLFDDTPQTLSFRQQDLTTEVSAQLRDCHWSWEVLSNTRQCCFIMLWNIRDTDQCALIIRKRGAFLRDNTNQRPRQVMWLWFLENRRVKVAGMVYLAFLTSCDLNSNLRPGIKQLYQY